MSFCLIVALILAFGLRPGVSGGITPPAETAGRVELVLLLAAVLLLLSLAIGRWIAWKARAPEASLRQCRRLLVRSSRMLDLLSVGLYAWVLFGLDWPALVERELTRRGDLVLDEALILAPYLVFQILSWVGLAAAEHALRPGSAPVSLGRHLLRHSRQAFGLVLPAALVFTIAQDVAQRYWSSALDSAWFQLGGLGVMGLGVLVLAPALVRLSWPTRSLAPGPLRDRLELLAARLNFRFTDILVWDTDRTTVNAGVTGILPFFRYVLLTDALIETLDEHQIEAVFGHEVGHVAHRHLAYFGFFFIGSMGIMALVGQGFSLVAEQLPELAPPSLTLDWDWGLELGVSLGWLVTFLAYVLLVFGYLSRRFERQADVYGCRAISCGRLECPPHTGALGPGRAPIPLCPTGIQTFSSALELVARLNGMEPQARSWRHGSIRDRVAFLAALVGRPEQERRFQRRIQVLRAVLAAGLLLALAAALATGALDQL
jgi:STE24 endopeptidase